MVVNKKPCCSWVCFYVSYNQTWLKLASCLLVFGVVGGTSNCWLLTSTVLSQGKHSCSHFPTFTRASDVSQTLMTYCTSRPWKLTEINFTFQTKNIYPTTDSAFWPMSEWFHRGGHSLCQVTYAWFCSTGMGNTSLMGKVPWQWQRPPGIPEYSRVSLIPSNPVW